MDEALVREYCPPLDEALLSAILYDYDLSDANGLQEARNTLDSLKQSALLEEATEFDPSGTGAKSGFSSPFDEGAESCPETSNSLSKGTDVTSLSNGMSLLDFEDDNHNTAPSPQQAEDLENLDEELKVCLLQDIFGSEISKWSIQNTLRKCDGRWHTALEEILNHVYFKDSTTQDEHGRIAVKSIDAFAEEHTSRGRKSGKRKGRSKRFRPIDEERATSLPGSSTSSAETRNKWFDVNNDIEFIASRTRILPNTVSSTYHENGASVSRTIQALVRESMEESKHLVEDDGVLQVDAYEMSQLFPTISSETMLTLLRMTYPSREVAHELATALVAKPRTPDQGRLTIIPHYAPWVDSIPIDSGRQSGSKAPVRQLASDDAADRAVMYAAMKNQAFSQARSAYRRAKSDRLMGGAAAYYSETAREHLALHSAASSAVADQLVARQSSATQVDLHGVDVVNGVRIAQNKVSEWWNGLGESKYDGRIGSDERQNGFRIIVGRGTHSQGGISRLGPAVGKALREGGWKADNEGAIIVVRGKAKRGGH